MSRVCQGVMPRSLSENSSGPFLGDHLESPAVIVRRPWRRCARPRVTAVESGLVAVRSSEVQAETQVARRARLEAVLLLAREPLSVRKLAKLANLTDGTEARTLLGQIRHLYQLRSSAFQVEEVAGGFSCSPARNLPPGCGD